MTKLKQIPNFKSEKEEAEFWSNHDLVDYFDPKNRISPDFQNLKPTTQSITIRLSTSMLKDLKTLANEQDVPYQSLLKTLLGQKLREVLRTKQVTK